MEQFEAPKVLLRVARLVSALWGSKSADVQQRATTVSSKME
jgi:hypothetical protein